MHSTMCTHGSLPRVYNLGHYALYCDYLQVSILRSDGHIPYAVGTYGKDNLSVRLVYVLYILWTVGIPHIIIGNKHLMRTKKMAQCDFLSEYETILSLIHLSNYIPHSWQKRSKRER